jgi:hypothetical protein
LNRINPEDGYRRRFRKVSNLFLIDVSSHPRRHESSSTALWESKIFESLLSKLLWYLLFVYMETKWKSH